MITRVIHTNITIIADEDQNLSICRGEFKGEEESTVGHGANLTEALGDLIEKELK